jgi:thiol-disulfide isomerase/thioredoxin
MRTRRAILAAGLLVSLWTCLSVAGVGQVGADFTLESASGERVPLARFLGTKPVLLVFWATWCPHCNAAVPAINGIQSRFSGRLSILAIDFMESREKVESFLKAKNVGYPVLFDRDGMVARSYGVVGIPTYVILDRQGKVVYFDNELPPSIEKFL